MRLFRLTASALIFGLLGSQFAVAQIATYSGGSVYDLDPKASQRTSDRILEQILTNNDMQPVNDMAEGDTSIRPGNPAT